MIGEPDFTIDLPYGEHGERLVKLSLEALSGWEIKRKRRYTDAVFFIEGWQHPHSLPCQNGYDCRVEEHWQPSSFNVTTAKHAAFVIGDTAVWVHMPARLLRSYVDCDVFDSRIRPGGMNGDNPTRGHIVKWDDLVAAADQASMKALVVSEAAQPGPGVATGDDAEWISDDDIRGQFVAALASLPYTVPRELDRALTAMASMPGDDGNIVDVLRILSS